LNEDEQRLLKLGPRFIYNDPRTAARRRTTELATLKRKIQARFYEKKVRPGRPVDQFIAELDIMLQNLHDVPLPIPRLNRSKEQQFIVNIPDEWIIQSQSHLSSTKKKEKKNYSRLVKRLRHKFRTASVLLQKTDKSKVFHLGKIDDYQKKSDDYMERTQAYRCLGNTDPLPELVQRTNKYLLDLRLAKWISQKQYESLSVKADEIELAHLYYLPKAHKVGTPLRPIIAGLKHPTVKISRFLDNLLRPLFDTISAATTVTSGFELLKRLNEWTAHRLNHETVLCTMDVEDLYTMIPQSEGVLSLKKMLDHLNMKQVEGLNIETVIRLSRFVMRNNYFSYGNRFYHQIRGGAMGSPLTLTIANCYMFFFERDIVRQVGNSNGLYVRYIDDIFISINWPHRHFTNQANRWNNKDPSIKLNVQISSAITFLDLDMELIEGRVQTKVFHKPSYEPYYLPFNSIHPMHMKKNIPYAMLLRAVRYCSSFQLYINERESLRMALLLNKYPGNFINDQFNRVWHKLNINTEINAYNYDRIRQQVLNLPNKEKTAIEYDKHIFVHFTYCSSMRIFPRRFHELWKQYFGDSPISEVAPILGTRNVDNLQRQLVLTRSRQLEQLNKET
jgi:hypothetical protein